MQPLLSNALVHQWVKNLTWQRSYRAVSRLSLLFSFVLRIRSLKLGKYVPFYWKFSIGVCNRLESWRSYLRTFSSSSPSSQDYFCRKRYLFLIIINLKENVSSFDYICMLYRLSSSYQRNNLIFPWQGSPFPTALDDETATLLDVGICDGSTLLVDEES